MIISDVKAKRCWLFHEWTVWNDQKIVGVYEGRIRSTPIYREVSQIRRCLSCGKLQSRSVDI